MSEDAHNASPHAPNSGAQGAIDLGPTGTALASRIRDAVAQGNYELREHAFERMIERNIDPKDVRHVVMEGQAIEYDESGVRGPDPQILFNGETSGGRPVHVKVGERTSGRIRYFVVTVYLPEPEVFEQEYSVRRRTN